MDNKRKPIIGVLMGNTQTEYSEQLIEGFCTAAKETDVDIIFLMRNDFPKQCEHFMSGKNEQYYNEQFGAIYDYVGYIRPDVLIIGYGSLSQRNAPSKEEIYEKYGQIPILITEDISDNDKIVDLVADYYMGMHDEVEHLILGHGYRRIAFLSGPIKSYGAQERLRAYLDAMEENGLTVTDAMVEYGDYSEHVEDLVENLLNNNSELEAIVFANDNMAKAGYRVCAKRGLVVGQDIAIAGFDDVYLAKNMTPPLTSVSHSGYQFSYQALTTAIRMCKGEVVESKKLPTILRIRQSCGCGKETQQIQNKEMSLLEIRDLIELRTQEMIDDLFEAVPYEREKSECLALTRDMFSYLYYGVFERKAEDFSYDKMIYHVKKLCSFRHVPNRAMIDHFVSLIRELLGYATIEKMRSTLAEVIEFAQRTVHSNDIWDFQHDIDQANLHAWFQASFLTELVVQNRTKKENILAILNRFKKMNLSRVYFFLYGEPMEKRGWVDMEGKTPMYLAGYYNDREMEAWDNYSVPIRAEDGGVAGYLDKEGGITYCSFALFSGEEHYGFMVCEVEQKDIQFMMICASQVAALFHILRLNEKERKAKEELHNSMLLIQEQNSILSVISSNDAMTKLLNRRGFMERAIQELRESRGMHAYLLFADLDHLKEINDCYGHAAGDMAITTAADYLRSGLPENAIIARFGGDEFVALVMSEEEDAREEIAAKIKESARIFNQESKEEFYVELSVGIYSFMVDEVLEVTELLKKSDEILYEEKRKRRSTVKKHSED